MEKDWVRLSDLLTEAIKVIERIGTDTHAMANAQDRILEAAMWAATALDEKDGE